MLNCVYYCSIEMLLTNGCRTAAVAPTQEGYKRMAGTMLPDVILHTATEPSSLFYNFYLLCIMLAG
jgi:hypothetical protein